MTSSCDPTDHDEDDRSERSHTHSQANRPHSSCCSRLQPPNFKIQPFDGNPKNYARFKAKFQALYEEYEDSPVLLFMLEVLAEEVRNEIGECLTDGTMYCVVWERLDVIYGRTKIMDQTYLDDLLQVPPLKSLDAASLKTFANRLHGAVAMLSKSKYAHKLHSRTTLMALEAKLTPYLNDKWNEKRKKTGVELNILDLDDWELAFAEECYALRKNLELPHSDQNFAPSIPSWMKSDRCELADTHARQDRKITDLRSRFWILSGRKVVKSVINNCWPCKRTSAKPSPPLMASLPVHSLTPHLPAFTYTGIDYFGPLTVRVGGRGRRHEKRWVSLFTCFTTRAVHLEVANGLSMKEFLLCFSRFVSLRGKPKVVYSDNGTNFVAAEQELRQALEELVAKHEELQTLMACQQIEWHISPPHGPHFGGVWERIVQSCKRAMKTSIGNCLVTDQVLRTVIAEVAALLNAQPLTNLSVDPEDPDPLTPNHFLYGGARPYLPLQLADVEDMNVTNKQFQQSQAILQHFWNRWLRKYVPHLTERRKWQENRPNVTVGDLVLVIEPNNLRGQWPMGKVLEVIPSAMDNVVRVVKVKLSNNPKQCIRPVAKLCIMVAAKVQEVYAKEEKKESSTV
ncbi:uncharacterized protein LOC130688067 [Daphnia carinata]|uniref:uncharacterized protein LOC130688067 n=1 Tax=Daphnia carinata TaxID=120202 RepID=UPI00257B1E65|nr:uncharacterized protein LOC130688067 [Daphnia carinata]